MKKRKNPSPLFEKSSGNIFADIGVANPEQALAKSCVALEIERIIKKKKLTQSKIAKILGITQPKVSLLLRGYLKSFSLERLFRFLNVLGQDIYIQFAPSTHSGPGRTMIGDASTHLQIAALGRC